MPTKVQAYAQLADETARKITGETREWAAFLTTAARLYKYNEQLGAALKGAQKQSVQRDHGQNSLCFNTQEIRQHSVID